MNLEAMRFNEDFIVNNRIDVYGKERDMLKAKRNKTSLDKDRIDYLTRLITNDRTLLSEKGNYEE